MVIRIDEEDDDFREAIALSLSLQESMSMLKMDLPPSYEFANAALPAKRPEIGISQIRNPVS